MNPFIDYAAYQLFEVYYVGSQRPRHDRHASISVCTQLRSTFAGVCGQDVRLGAGHAGRCAGGGSDTVIVHSGGGYSADPGGASQLCRRHRICAAGLAAPVPESPVTDWPASTAQQEKAGDTHDGQQPSSSGNPLLASSSPALRALAGLLPDPATLSAEAPPLRQRLLDEASRRALALIRPAGALPTLLDLPGVSADTMPLTTNALVTLVCKSQRVFRALASASGASQLDARTLATVDALRWATHAVLELARDLCSARDELQQLRASDAGSLAAITAELAEERRQLEAVSSERDALRRRLAVVSRERDGLRQRLADANAKYARKSPRRLEEAGAHQAVARLNSEMPLVRAGLRRHESASRELVELRAAVASRLGTVDEVADFCVSHAQSSNIDPAVLRFALEACRCRRSEGWVQVLFMAMPLPGQSLPTLPPADV
ncbi:hypothetical protein P43SY_004040 [Pythium insidiosum]|uniref:Uncharacterized protein n=1 Tax=Pythium insidiosum TaxID=114742 RepID=A0AAD5Q5T9_PYTIN|nr:hypothetical protein P43SY_004040 [Pythium insidiosum]